MYTTELNSDIAQFLAMRTDCMKKVLDHIPPSPQFFKLYFRNKQLNWYEFWDHIAEVRPVACKLVTDLFVVVFNEAKLRWECESSCGEEVREHVSIICEALNENFIRSSIINSWERARVRGLE